VRIGEGRDRWKQERRKQERVEKGREEEAGKRDKLEERVVGSDPVELMSDT
jgi:hypothetical protein